MARRRVGFVVLLALLVVGALLFVLPAGAGAIRVAGVSLAWWYAIVVAPVAATLVVLVVAAPADLRTPALWVTPALVVPLAAQIVAAVPAAPFVALVAVLAPALACLVRAPDARALPRPLGAGLLTGAVALLAAANFLVIGDVAHGLGGQRWHGIVPTAVIALALAWWPDTRWRTPTLVASVTVLAIALAAVATAVGATPWRAWSRLASRPVVAFTERSAWVRDGGAVSMPITMTLTEPQRLTAMTPALWRVVIDDGAGPAMREWRLAAGDSLALRPGDRVAIPAGARVRFEPGQRVPGAPLSGVAWADAMGEITSSEMLATVGAALTLVGGALVLRTPWSGSPTAPSRLSLPMIALSVLIAVGCGVYAADVGADLAVGAPAASAFVRLPGVVVSGASGAVLTLLTLLALVGLLTTAQAALADHAVAAWYPGGNAAWRPRALRAGLVLASAALALVPATPWNVLMLGFGLAAAGLAPTLVEAPRPTRVLSSIVGAVAVGVLVFAGPWLAPTTPALAVYPALLAVPLAATAGWVAAGRRG